MTLFHEFLLHCPPHPPEPQTLLPLASVELNPHGILLNPDAVAAGIILAATPPVRWPGSPYLPPRMQPSPCCGLPGCGKAPPPPAHPADIVRRGAIAIRPRKKEKRLNE